MNITIKNIHYVLLKLEKHLILSLYKMTIPYKVKKIRKKDRIRVLFVIAELGPWKTELLYKAMLAHQRFDPYLGVTLSPESPLAKSTLINYLKKQGYEFCDLDGKKNLNIVHPDIVIYQKPYEHTYLQDIKFTDNLDKLFCYTNYYFFNTKEPAIYQGDVLFKIAWQVYVESESVKKEMEILTGCNNSVIKATGIPMADRLLKQSTWSENPWKCINKKRIIYAPHHSIGNEHTGSIDFGTFDKYGEFILNLAEKYKGKIHMAFKPHPVLYSKLVRLWGQQKTDDYYRKWSELENTQFEDGEYTALFQYSDAMIHDCNSFSIEYLYTKKPVMYLVSNDLHTNNISELGKKCFYAHYLGYSKEDIERFIIDIINGKDPYFAKRQEVFNSDLKPCGENDACTNIIETIIGKS